MDTNGHCHILLPRIRGSDARIRPNDGGATHATRQSVTVTGTRVPVNRHFALSAEASAQRRGRTLLRRGDRTVLLWPIMMLRRDYCGARSGPSFDDFIERLAVEITTKRLRPEGSGGFLVGFLHRC